MELLMQDEIYVILLLLNIQLNNKNYWTTIDI